MKRGTNPIATFIHCADCVDSIPDGESARTWGHLEIGITPKGEIVVWCVRHEKLVGYIGKSKIGHSRCDHCEDVG